MDSTCCRLEESQRDDCCSGQRCRAARRDHQPGVRNVLRVNHHEIQDPPADAPSQAFVLDMVVESDTSGAK